MVKAQYEMDTMVMEYWKEKSQKFTTRLLTVMVFCVTLAYLINEGIIDVHKIIG
jgi:hypothetical protein